MATEKINLTAPEELVGTPAEDTQTTSTVAPNQGQTIDNDSTPLTEPVMSEEFADEEAALAADEAGLSIGEETAEEQEAAPHSGDDLSGLGEAELVATFAAKIEIGRAHV